jgi:mono/diheme cytochrome c family protein
MKNFLKGLLLIFFAASISSCGGGEDKKEKGKLKIGEKKETKKDDTKKEGEEKTYDLSNKGVGPITSVTLGETIDQAMVAAGAETYKTKCTACHKIGKKFIGPAPNGVLKRRSPEWIMNMILDPEGMVKNDPVAKELLMEYNGSPMANQSLTEEEARNILEYFRTLE